MGLDVLRKSEQLKIAKIRYKAKRRNIKRGKTKTRRTISKRKVYHSKTKRIRKTYRKKRTRRTPHTAGKRKDTSRRRIRMTKNGQPYIILANGRARFIKKSSARTSRKRRGGRY